MFSWLWIYGFYYESDCFSVIKTQSYCVIFGYPWTKFVSSRWFYYELLWLCCSNHNNYLYHFYLLLALPFLFLSYQTKTLTIVVQSLLEEMYLDVVRCFRHNARRWAYIKWMAVNYGQSFFPYLPSQSMRKKAHYSCIFWECNYQWNGQQFGSVCILRSNPELFQGYTVCTHVVKWNNTSSAKIPVRICNMSAKSLTSKPKSEICSVSETKVIGDISSYISQDSTLEKPLSDISVDTSNLTSEQTLRLGNGKEYFVPLQRILAKPIWPNMKLYWKMVPHSRNRTAEYPLSFMKESGNILKKC